MNIEMPIGTRITISASMRANTIEPMAIPLMYRLSSRRLAMPAREAHLLHEQIESRNRQQCKARHHQSMRDPHGPAQDCRRLAHFLDRPRTDCGAPGDHRAISPDQHRAEGLAQRHLARCTE